MRQVFFLIASITLMTAAYAGPAPGFVLQSLEGRTVRLSQYRGKVVLVNFWATWCGGCKVEMPWLVELERRYRAQGLEIVGVSMDDAGDDVVTKFAKTKNVNYTIVRGSEAVAKAYGNVQMLPQTFLVGRDGNTAGHFTGVPDKGEFEKAIRELLRGR